MADTQQDLMTLVRNLNDVEIHKDLRLTRAYIYEILTLSTNGCDIIPALPTVVKLLAHTDTFVKRVAGELIAIHAEQNPEMVLLATNTLVQNCKDVNPVIRSHGLCVLGSLQSPSAVELLSTAITEGIEDSSPLVRRSAAMASITLHQVSPTSVTEGGIWDILYNHLSDPDSATVCSCLCALEEIFAKESGVVMSNKLGQYLVSNLSSYTPVTQRFVLQFLLKHSPKSKAQIFEHLNDLDASLTSSTSLATTLSALEVFCHLANGLAKIKFKAYSVAWEAIKKNLARERDEGVVTAVIDYLSTTKFPVSICVQDYNKFFCRDDDSIFLVKQKIRMLSRLITSDNKEDIFDELVRGARHLDPCAVREMVQSVTEEMSAKPEVEKSCIEFLRRLMQLGNPGVLECVLQVLPALTLNDTSLWVMLAPCLQDCHQRLQSISGKIALLDLIRIHSTLLDNAAEIVEEMMAELEAQQEEESLKHHKGHHLHSEQISCHNRNRQKLKLSLLGAMVKICLENPAKIQLLLAQLMEMCIKDKNRNVRDRALFWYGYLVGKVKQVSAGRMDNLP